MASSPFSRRRLIMQLKRCGLPEVISLGRYNHTAAHPGLRGHSHPGAIEICFLVKGRQTYRVRGHDYRLRGGDLFLTFPDEWHGTGEAPEEKGVLYWLVLQLPRRGGSFLGLPPRQGRALLQGLTSIASRHFRGSPRIKEDLDAITLLYQQEMDPLISARIANRLQDFLIEVILCSQRPQVTAPRNPLQPVLDHIAGHREETFRVSDLAARAGLSVAQFNVRFREAMGVPPAEFVLRGKIEEARRRLERGGRTITDIAYDLGFSSSQYFATVFKRLEGISPRDVRPPPA